MFFLAKLPTSGSDSWIYSYFSNLRSEAIGHASAITALCMGIACTLVVLKMIKLSYTLMSDDRNSGFGGVQLWEIIRPVLIILAINSTSLFVGVFDGITSKFTTSISVAVAKVDHKAALTDLCKQIEAEAGDYLTKEQMAIIEQANSDSQNYYGTIKKNGKTALGRWIARMMADSETQKKYADALIASSALPEDERPTSAEIRRMMRKYLHGNRSIEDAADGNTSVDLSFTSGDFMPVLANWLYDMFYCVVQCMAEILLCVLAVLAPVTLMLSVLDIFKDGIGTMLSTYLQLSFWKVIAAVINWVIAAARSTALSDRVLGSLRNMGNALNSGSESAGATGQLWLASVIALAGIMALFKIQSIAQAIIPSKSSFGDAAGIGGALATAAMSAPTKALSAGAKLAKGAADSRKSGNRMDKINDQIGEINDKL